MHDTHALYLSVIIPNISIGIQNRVTMIKEGQGGAKRFPDRQIMTGSAAGFFWAKCNVCPSFVVIWQGAECQCRSPNRLMSDNTNPQNQESNSSKLFQVKMAEICAVVLMGWIFVFYSSRTPINDNDDHTRRMPDPKTIELETGVLNTFLDGNLTAPGQTQIQVYPVGEVDLPHDTPVIGVVVDGQARAYLPKGMSEPEWHLAHDTIQGQPITITYCNWNDCVHTFMRGSVPPEEIMMGGFQHGHMQLLIRNTYYDQNSTQIPLNPHPMKRLTLGEWKATYPKSEIYLGDQAQKE